GAECPAVRRLGPPDALGQQLAVDADTNRMVTRPDAVRHQGQPDDVHFLQLPEAAMRTTPPRPKDPLSSAGRTGELRVAESLLAAGTSGSGWVGLFRGRRRHPQHVAVQVLHAQLIRAPRAAGRRLNDARTFPR